MWINVPNALIKCCDYARSLSMPDHLTYLTRLYMQGLHRFPNMAQYATIISEYASECLNA